jgi:hypothetical protein
MFTNEMKNLTLEGAGRDAVAESKVGGSVRFSVFQNYLFFRG